MATIDFLYYGEANVFQENLESFLSMAEELKLKGLTGQQNVSEDNTEAYKKEMTTNLTSKREKWISNKRRNNFASQNELAIIESHQEKAVQNFVSGDLQELDEKVKSMMESSQNLTYPMEERGQRFAKYVGKKDIALASETTSRPIISRGSPFRATSVKRLSGQENY